MSKEIEYCMKCGKENNPDNSVCKCGGRDFVWGRNFTYSTENGVVCDCGNKQLKKISHVNMSPIYNTTYQCVCGNIIKTQIYYESPYLQGETKWKKKA